MKSANGLKKLISFIISISILFSISVTGLAHGRKEIHEVKKIDPIQEFLLDAMETKNSKEIGKYLSTIKETNISGTAKKVAKILKKSWDSKKGISTLEGVLKDFMDFTPKAKFAVIRVVEKGFEGVKIPKGFSNDIRERINQDFTGKSKDDRGIKFMIKALQILQNEGLVGEKLVTVNINEWFEIDVSFNKFENAQYIKSSVSEVLGKLNSLPFSPKSFDSFIQYYERLINKSSTTGTMSFINILTENNISVQINTK